MARKKKNDGLGNILIIIGILGVMISLITSSSGISFGGTGGSGGTPETTVTDIVCDVSIGEKFFGDFSIQGTPTCTIIKTKSSCGGVSRFLPFGFFSEEGTVKIFDSTGLIGQKKFSTGTFTDTVVVAVSACTADNTISIRAENKDGNLVDSKQVSLI